MQDLYLSFPDEDTAKAVLFTDDRQNYLNIDTIGVIYKDEQAIPGWHVNVRLMPDEDGSALSAYQVNPATPIRVWG